MTQDLTIQAAVVVNSEKAEQSFDRLGNKAGAMAATVTGAADKAGRAVDGIGAGAEQGAERFTRAEGRMRDSIKRSTETLQQFGKTASEKFEINIQTKGLDATKLAPYVEQLKQAESQAAKTAASIEKMGGASLSTSEALVRMTVVGLGLLAIVGTVNAVSKSLFDASVAAERLRIGLDFASGGNGAREMAYVTDLSNKLGLSLQSTASSYMSFAAASRGTALEGQASKAVFESVAKAAAVMGLSTEQTSGTLLALQQMMSKGTVQAEELRGQLGERLPGAFQIAARAMGVTTQELGKMLETGKVLADDFLPKFASQLESEIGGGAEKAAQRLGAATNRMETSLFRLKVALGDTGIAEWFAGGLNRSTSIFNMIAGDVEKLNSQGGLRKAAADVNELNIRQANLKNGIAAGFYGQGFKTELDAVSAKLEIAKQKFRELDAASKAILSGAGGGRGSLNPATTTQLYAKDAAAKAERDAYYAQDIRQTKEQIRTEEIGKARKANALLVAKAEGDTNEVLKLQKALSVEIGNINERNKDKKIGGGAGGESELASIRAKVIETQRYIDTLKAQGLEAAKQTEGERLAAKYREQLNGGLKGAARANKEAELAQAEKLAGQQKEIAGIEALLKAQKDFEAARDREAVSRQSVILKIDEQAQALEDEAAMYGKGKEAIEALRIARLEEKKATLLQFDGSDQRIQQINDEIAATRRLAVAGDAVAALKMGTHTDELIANAKEQASLYQDELKLTGLTGLEREKIVAMRQVELKYAKELQKVNNSNLSESDKEAQRQKIAEARQIEGSAAVAKVVQDDWAKTADQINQSLTDALLRGFESGKSFASNFRDTLINMFKTLVLKPVISFIVNPISQAITGVVNSGLSAVGLGGSGNSALGLANNASSLNTLYGAGAQYLTGSTAGASGASLVYANGIGAVGGDSIGALYSANGGWAGVAAGGATAAGAGSAFAAGGASSTAFGVGAGATGAADLAIGSTAAGGAAAGGATAGLAAIPVYGWIALAAIAAYAAFSGKGDSRFGSQGSYTPGVGSTSNGGPNGANDDFGGVTAANKISALGIDATLEKLGSKDRLKYFAGGFESSEQGKGFSYAGGILSNGKTFGQGTDGLGYQNNRGSMNAEEAQAAYVNELKQSTLQALQSATDIPKSISEKLKGVDIDALKGPALDGLIAQIDKVIGDVDAFQDAIKRLPFENLKNLSFDAASSLIDLSGGIDKLAAAGSFYYDNFYSEAERTANAAKNLGETFTGLGVTLPASKDAFRSLMDAQDLSTESGRKLYAALLQVAPAFASVADAAVASAARIADIKADYMTQGEQRDSVVDRIQKNLYDSGVNLTRDQIANGTRQDARALWESLDAKARAGGGDNPAYRAQADAILANGKDFASITGPYATAAQPIGFGGSTGSGSSGGGASTTDPWKSAADAIVSAIKDLKSSLIETGPDSFARLQAQYAIDVARAKAGDLTAAQGLPELAKSLVNAGKDYSQTAAEQAILTARVIETLGSVVETRTGVKVPGFAVGTNYVPQDMLAVVHQGEAIIPRAYNPANGGGANNGELVAEIRALREEVASLRFAANETATATKSTAKTLDMAAGGARPLTTMVLT